MYERPVTNLLVPGRGHELRPDGSLGLSRSAEQRVDAAERYYHQHADAFEQASIDGSGGMIVMAGGYAKLASGDKLPPPPYKQRESTLMCARGRQAGIPARYLHSSSASTSTLENVLRAQEEGYFSSVDSNIPLGVVTQRSQWDRLNWFAQRVFKLPEDAVVLIAAPGEEDVEILRDERRLFAITKVVYGRARTPSGLRRAEWAVSQAARVAVRLGVQQPPAERYASTST